MENYKNLKEDKEFFPYEYGASRYSQTSRSIMKLSIREELASNIDLIYTHMDENGVVFSSPGFYSEFVLQSIITMFGPFGYGRGVGCPLLNWDIKPFF
jgi:hypothetical protein